MLGILAVGCGVAAARVPTVSLAQWMPYIHLASPIDVVGPAIVRYRALPNPTRCSSWSTRT